MKNNITKTDQEIYIENHRREIIFIKAARVAVLLLFITI